MRAPIELNPCPFCGETDQENFAYGPGTDDEGFTENSCVVECQNCGTRGPWAKEYKEASQLWNKRV